MENGFFLLFFFFLTSSPLWYYPVASVLHWQVYTVTSMMRLSSCLYGHGSHSQYICDHRGLLRLTKYTLVMENDASVPKPSRDELNNEWKKPRKRNVASSTVTSFYLHFSEVQSCGKPNQCSNFVFVLFVSLFLSSLWSFGFSFCNFYMIETFS